MRGGQSTRKREGERMGEGAGGYGRDIREDGAGGGRAFSVHFMAEIRLYSQWQIISFFPISAPKFPIPMAKVRKYVVKQRFWRD